MQKTLKRLFSLALVLVMAISCLPMSAFATGTPALPTATVSDLNQDNLTFAMNFKADEITPEQLEYYGNWYADFVLTVNKDVTFDANGGADGYLSGQYDGQWKDDKQHGTGTFTWANGTVYTGDWSKGERTGEGTMTWASGDKYVGAFKNGYRHGKGTYYYPNGNVYEGDFVDGKR